MEERLRQDLPIPAPRPEFRARLRAEFIATEFIAGGPTAGDRFVDPEPAARRRGFRLLLGGTGLAAAAAVLVMLAVPGEAPGGPVFDGGWRVTTAVQDGGLVRVDGDLLSLGDKARIEAAWNAGRPLEAQDEPLVLVHPDGVRISLQPGTLTRLGEDTQMAASPAWLLDLERGEVLLATDTGYTGRPIAFTTPDTSVLVTGTALSVMYEERGTCVCVEHGSVIVHCLRSGVPMHVGDEETCFVYNDGKPPFEGAFCQAVKLFGEPMLPNHIEPLRSFSK